MPSSPPLREPAASSAGPSRPLSDQPGNLHASAERLRDALAQWDDRSNALLLIVREDDVWRAARNVVEALAVQPSNPPAPAAVPSWRCFHCDEVFTDRAEASEHFGADEWKIPACRLSREDVGILRTLEGDIVSLRRENEELENDSRLWHESEADRVRRIGRVQWWQELDSKQGEIIALSERVKELEAALASSGAASPRMDTNALRRELLDKLEVYASATQNPLNGQGAIVKQQVLDFLTELYRDPPAASVGDPIAICRICQMRLPERLVTFGIGPRGGTDAVCAACCRRAGLPVDEEKRAEVVALRKQKLAASVGDPQTERE